MKDSLLRQSGIGQYIYKFYSNVFYFLPILISNYRFRMNFFIPFYRNKNRSKINQDIKKVVIYMVLKETTFSGGLSDRLRGVCAIYKECKKQRLPFKIVFEPLHLENYLQPVINDNKYLCDWRIKSEEISFDMNKAYPCTILTYHANSKNRYQHFVQSSLLRYFISKPFRQIHVYSNMICKDGEYGNLFKELFEPTKELKEQIDYHLGKIGGKQTYISCTFRFRQLLGDFKEGGDILSESERELYIRKCCSLVEKLHKNNLNKKILVTSDSITFLERVSKFSFVYIIPGKVVHIGFIYDASKQTYMKSFIDYFMLSYAQKVYLVRDKLMYHSGFPFRAALLNGAEYGEIRL